MHEDALYQEIDRTHERRSLGHVALGDAVAGAAAAVSSSTTGATPVGGTHTTDGGFWELWDSETNRLSVFLQAQQQNLEFSAKALLVNVEAAMRQLEESHVDEAEATAISADEDLIIKFL